MWVHDLSPFIVRISGDFGLRWYGFSYVMGFVAAYFMMKWLVSRQKTGLTNDQISDFITYIAFGTLIGGRLGYVFFYSIDLLWKVKPEFPFWGVLAVNEGGMASHGGIIGIIVAVLLYAKKSGQPFLYLLDLAAVSGPIGVFFGRIANFINGELVGRIAPSDFEFSVKFPTDILHWPATEFERLKTLTPVMEKMGILPEKWIELVDKFRLDSMSRSQVYDLLSSVVDKIQSGNIELKMAIAPLLDGRYPSQLFAAVGEGLLTWLILMFIWRKARKPGIVAASFVMVYAIVRISDEFFRMPDAHIGFQMFGLTRGQLLSIVMFFVGAVMMFVWNRTGGSTIPGWSKLHSIKIGRGR